ncbi:hypothetical protein AK812_SmicGene44409 [Symbiodinium microadriaticum]|uniref:Uncharacterized protein n=1 Tax=Symbiodinium microadriaticum TaxID=2951 RepID=A0A1Q9BYI8_SYMMI|nr:hypothetical protein AK812_SmicGene44409 [Symbiodinium microadriaticum]
MISHFSATQHPLPDRNLEIEESLRIGGQIKARRHKKQLTKEDRSTYNDSDNHNSGKKKHGSDERENSDKLTTLHEDLAKRNHFHHSHCCIFIISSKQYIQVDEVFVIFNFFDETPISPSHWLTSSSMVFGENAPGASSTLPPVSNGTAVPCGGG